MLANGKESQRRFLFSLVAPDNLGEMTFGDVETHKRASAEFCGERRRPCQGLPKRDMAKTMFFL